MPRIDQAGSPEDALRSLSKYLTELTGRMEEVQRQVAV
jgi:hypothetical protein